VCAVHAFVYLCMHGYPETINEITTLLEGYQGPWTPSANSRTRQQQPPMKLSQIISPLLATSITIAPTTVPLRAATFTLVGSKTPTIFLHFQELPGQARIGVATFLTFFHQKNTKESPRSYLISLTYHIAQTQRSAVLDDTCTALTLLIKS